MSSRRLLARFLLWRSKNIGDQYYIIILSAIVGFLAGIAAFVLKTTVFYIKDLLTADLHMRSGNLQYVFYPMIGVFLTLLFMKYVVKDSVLHGIPRILFVISRQRSKMKRHKVFSSIIGASLTAGFGGSIGLESPIISTGSSLGSNLGQVLKLSYNQRTLLIGCGAAGAIASIFTTPIAAVIFSLEVLMLDLTTFSIIPLLTSSAVGALTTKVLFSENILFHFRVIEKFDLSDIPFFFALGIVTGLVSLYFSRMHYFISARMIRIGNVYLKAFVALLFLGLIIYLFPPLYGEGYETIKLIVAGRSAELLNNSIFYDYRDIYWVFGLFVLFLVIFKVIATTLTLESGGVGGIFAPSAVMGGLTGFLFARTINDIGITGRVSEINFTLVGMAGVLGGVLHAPLTSIFLIAEMTNGYELIVPLMVTSTISYVTIKVFDPHSIFTKRLAERGELLTHHKDQAVLTLLSIKDVIDTDLLSIAPGSTLGDLVKLISLSKRNIFPVVTEWDDFAGIIDMDDVRHDMFIKEKYSTPIEEYMIQPTDYVSTYEAMDSVMQKFNKSGYYNLPVIDHGKYVGFVSRAHVFNAYRKILIDVSMKDF